MTSVSAEEISLSAHPSGCSCKIILVVLDRLFKPMKGKSLCLFSEIEKGRQIITVAPQRIFYVPYFLPYLSMTIQLQACFCKDKILM